MAIAARQVSAVLVTRGDVPLEPILETLPYEDIVIWDDRERGSQGVYGRYLAMPEARHEVVYFQDDDVLFTAHAELLGAYKPGRITCNMPSPWYERTGYDQLGMHLVGAGSLVPQGLPQVAFREYLEQWPEDDLFRDYCDFVSGMASPGQRFDFGYEILEHAVAPGRINTRPDSLMRRNTILNRALTLRAAA